jgi:polyferredoxin/copper chaperone CopZ
MFKFKEETNYFKNTFQIIILLLLAYMVIRLFTDANYIADFEAYCPFGGMMALSSFLVSNTLACSMTEAQIFMGIALIAGVILFSKLFCSHVCPLGTFTEWLGKLGDKIKMRFTIKGIADRVLRILKYALLFITFYFTINSSELFCKEYDPFYAIFSGFGHDVVLMYAIPSLAVMILGAVFIRQFWCKYLCPLSAATNIFSYFFVFAVIMTIYLILLYAGVEISWVWPLAVICIAGFLLESITMKGLVFPSFKITRNELTCTDCEECDLSCPMGIKVSTSLKVNHIDCHLCGDCLYSCPEKGTLQINKKEIKWMPATASVSLIALALYLATVVELPTINMKWGNDEQLSYAGIYQQSGLKNIKCFGSSSSFASKMKRVPGILGVETYVQSHTVKVYYDTTVLNDESLKKVIFTPTKTLLRTPAIDDAEIAVIEIGIDKLFDTYDSFYLQQLLKQNENVYGIKTEFGEPVHAWIYFNRKQLASKDLKKIIESEELTYMNRGNSFTVPLKFQVDYVNDSLFTVSQLDFMQQMFESYDQVFNDYKNHSNDLLEIYRISMPQVMNPAVRRQLSFLISHLSTDTSIVRFNTLYTENPVADIYFIKDKVNEEKIYSALTSDTLTVHYRGGKTGKMKNPFIFKEKGEILKAE